MPRILPIAFAAAVLAVAGCMSAGQAQTRYPNGRYETGQQNTGDGWMNDGEGEEDRPHMTPPGYDRGRPGTNSYGDRYENGTRGYDPRDAYRDQRRPPNDYGQYRGDDRRSYGNYGERRYHDRYERDYDGRQEYRRAQPGRDNDDE